MTAVSSSSTANSSPSVPAGAVKRVLKRLKFLLMVSLFARKTPAIMITNTSQNMTIA